MRILTTGGAAVLVDAKLIYAGNRRSIRDCEARPSVEFLDADIHDATRMRANSRSQRKTYFLVKTSRSRGRF
jgi:dTDP-D-glucose 4,6-dehydratase